MKKNIVELHKNWIKRLNISGPSRYAKLAKMLGYSYQTFANYRNKNEMPEAVILSVENKINYILSGNSLGVNLNEALFFVHYINSIDDIGKVGRYINEKSILLPKYFMPSEISNNLFLYENNEEKKIFQKKTLLLIEHFNGQNFNNAYYILKINKNDFIIKYVERQINNVVIKNNKEDQNIETVLTNEEFFSMVKCKIVMKIEKL